MSYNPIVVTLSSLKPCFFKSLKERRLEEIDGGVSAYEEPSKRSLLVV